MLSKPPNKRFPRLLSSCSALSRRSVEGSFGVGSGLTVLSSLEPSPILDLFGDWLDLSSLGEGDKALRLFELRWSLSASVAIVSCSRLRPLRELLYH